MPDRPAVLCVGAGRLQQALFDEAVALGLTVFATDAAPPPPGATPAETIYTLDTYAVRGHEVLARHLRQKPGIDLRGVVTCGADVAPSVAAAAAAAGVPGIPLEVAQRTHDKAAVRRDLEAAGLHRYQPRWLVFNIEEGRDEAYAAALRDAWLLSTALLPCVVKPLSQRASRGVTLVTEFTALSGALATAARYGRECLVEECLVGTEHSVELILRGPDEVCWRNIVDRPFDYSSGVPIERGHVNPTCLDMAASDSLYRMARQAAAALGVTWGPFKVDAMVTADGPKILECTARLSGGFDSQGTSPLTGRHPIRLLLQLACELPLDPVPRPYGYAACAAILPQQQGTLRRLLAWSRCDLGPGAPRIADIHWMVEVGDPVQPAAHNGARAGFVLSWAPVYEDAWTLATLVAQYQAQAMEIE